MRKTKSGFGLKVFLPFLSLIGQDDSCLFWILHQITGCLRLSKPKDLGITNCIYLFSVCTCCSVCVEAREQFVRIGFLLPPYESQGSKSGCQARWQEPTRTEPSHSPACFRGPIFGAFSCVESRGYHLAVLWDPI